MSQINSIYSSKHIKSKSNIIHDISNNLFIYKPSFIKYNIKNINTTCILDDNDEIIINLKNKFDKLKIQKYKLVYKAYYYYNNIKIIKSIII